MITINDLNLTVECWEFICELTEDFKGNASTVKESFENKYLAKRNKYFIQVLAYQAIDGFNMCVGNDKNKYIDQYDSFIIVFIRKDMPLYNRFLYCDYENRTIARLAALQWVFEQEIGGKR
jgi:hypothetical protein